MKAKNLSSLIFMFILLMILLAGPFILQYVQCKDKEKFGYDKCKKNLKGSVYFMVDFGLLNILLGGAHILAENDSDLQVGILMIIEISFITFNIVNLRDRKNVF